MSKDQAWEKLTISDLMLRHEDCKKELASYQDELKHSAHLMFDDPEAYQSLLNEWSDRLQTDCSLRRHGTMTQSLPPGVSREDLGDDNYPICAEIRERFDWHPDYRTYNDELKAAQAEEHVESLAQSEEFLTSPLRRMTFGNCTNFSCRRIGPIPHYCGTCNDKRNYFTLHCVRLDAYRNVGLNPKFVAAGYRASTKLVSECYHHPVSRLRDDGNLLNRFNLTLSFVRDHKCTREEARDKASALMVKAESYYDVQQGKRKLEDILTKTHAASSSSA